MIVLVQNYRFLHLYLINFYAEQFVGKVIIKLELILFVNLATFWNFRNDTSFTARQRLKSPLKLSILS